MTETVAPLAERLGFAPDAKLAVAVAVLALLHHAFGLLERHGRHTTHNAKMAAALLPTIPAWPGSKRSAFHVGMATTSLAGVLTMVLVTSGVGHPAALALCAVVGWLGLFLYEQAYVRAGQLPPLS